MRTVRFAANWPPSSRRLFNDVNETFQVPFSDQDNSSRLRAEDLPLALRNRFIGVTGKYLIQVYPERRLHLEPRSPGGICEGSPYAWIPMPPARRSNLYEYTKLLKDSYIQAAYYALGVIAVMVLFHFHSVRFLLLSLLPVAIGTICLDGRIDGVGSASLSIPRTS